MNSQYNKLRDWLDSILDNQVKDIARTLLTTQEQTSLSVPFDMMSRTELLGALQRLGRLGVLEKYLEENFVELKPRLSQANTSGWAHGALPFTNREDELALIISSHAPAYHLIDAPAGYGKTELLLELKKRFEEQNWLCSYVIVGENDALGDVVKYLGEDFDLKFDDTSAQSDDSYGYWMASALQQKEDLLSKEGVVILIDNQNNSLIGLIRKILVDLIPNIQSGLRVLESFSTKHNRFRVILAGRFLAYLPEIKNIPIRLTITRLSPFSYDVVNESTRNYFGIYSEEAIRHLSSHLLYFSGGHPGLMVEALKLYKANPIPSDKFFDDAWDLLWTKRLSNYMKKIYGEIVLEQRELWNVIEWLSVFRYVDYSIIRYALQTGNIHWNGDEYNLTDALTKTYLLDWRERLLRDSITRNLVAINIRQQFPEVFFARCQDAKLICEIQVKELHTQRPEVWVIEYLFQSLQQQFADIKNFEDRQALRRQFLNHSLKQILQIYFYEREIPLRNRREELMSLIEALEKDWEFRFTVNYYLRGYGYDDEPFAQLQQNIMIFFESMSEI